MNWNNRKLILSFRILAMFDVLFCDKFELIKYDKNRIKGVTKFDYNEIKKAKL